MQFLVNFRAIKKALAQSRRTDEENIRLFDDAKNDQFMEGEKEYYVCQICGHIHRSVVPGKCPVCQAVPGRFKHIL